MAGRFALLIGNKTFRHSTLQRLAAPHNDVRALHALLENEEIAGFKVDLKLDASLIDAKAAIGALFEARQPDDLVLFYYSGHGLRDRGGTFYLSMTETDPQNPDPGSIDEFWLRKRMNNCASRRQVIVLDCCHSGAMIPDGFTARGASPVLHEQTLDPTGHGRFILAATTKDSSAFERDGSSVYTRYLVEGLRTGDAAPDNERISINDLHNYVARKVIEGWPDLERPQLWTDASVNPEPLYIARNANVRKRLDAALVKQLSSDDERDVKSAVFRLIEIAETDRDGLRTDALRVMMERLERGASLSYLVGTRINRAISTNYDNITTPERGDISAKNRSYDSVSIFSLFHKKPFAGVGTMSVRSWESWRFGKREVVSGLILAVALAAFPVQIDKHSDELRNLSMFEISSLNEKVSQYIRKIEEADSLINQHRERERLAQLSAEQQILRQNSIERLIEIQNIAMSKTAYISPKEVMAAKNMLIKLGYFSGAISDFDNGQINSAVIKFQKDNGLNITGTLNRGIFEAIEFVALEK